MLKQLFLPTLFALSLGCDNSSPKAPAQPVTPATATATSTTTVTSPPVAKPGSGAKPDLTQPTSEEVALNPMLWNGALCKALLAKPVIQATFPKVDYDVSQASSLNPKVTKKMFGGVCVYNDADGKQMVQVVQSIPKPGVALSTQFENQTKPQTYKPSPKEILKKARVYAIIEMGEDDFTIPKPPFKLNAEHTKALDDFKNTTKAIVSFVDVPGIGDRARLVTREKRLRGEVTTSTQMYVLSNQQILIFNDMRAKPSDTQLTTLAKEGTAQFQKLHVPFAPAEKNTRPKKTTPLADSAISNDGSCRRLLTKEAITSVWSDLSYNPLHVTTLWKEERHTNSPGVCIYTAPKRGVLLHVVQIPLKKGEDPEPLFKTNTTSRPSSPPTTQEIAQRTQMLQSSQRKGTDLKNPAPLSKKAQAELDAYKKTRTTVEVEPLPSLGGDAKLMTKTIESGGDVTTIQVMALVRGQIFALNMKDSSKQNAIWVKEIAKHVIDTLERQ